MALDLLQMGKLLRRKAWPDLHCLIFHPSGLRAYNGHRWSDARLTADDVLNASDWEVVEDFYQLD